MRKFLIAPVAVLALTAVTGLAVASEEGDDMSKPGASGDWLTKEQVTRLFVDQGYQVRQVKVEDDGYELYAIDKEGNRIESDVDPVTGELLHTDMDD